MANNALIADDAWDWSVDDVVHKLCQSSDLWSDRPNSTLTDPVKFEQLLRNNNVSGSTLLALTPEDLRVELALWNLGDRHTVFFAIAKLRALSKKYQSLSPTLESNVRETESASVTSNSVPTCSRVEIPGVETATTLQGTPSLTVEGANMCNNDKTKGRAVLHHIEDPNEVLSAAQGNIQAANDSEWEFLLDKYPSGGGNDTTLPLYGDSEHDGYGSSTEAEIDREVQESERILAKKSKCLTSAAVESIVKEVVEQMTQESHLVQPPLNGPDAQHAWDESHDKKYTLRDCHAWVKRFDSRLENLQREIKRTKWSTEKELRGKCESMRETISDRHVFEWKLKVCQMSERPSQIAPIYGRVADYGAEQNFATTSNMSTAKSRPSPESAGQSCNNSIDSWSHCESSLWDGERLLGQTAGPTCFSRPSELSSNQRKTSEETIVDRVTPSKTRDYSTGGHVQQLLLNEREAVVQYILMEICSSRAKEDILKIFMSVERAALEHMTKDNLKLMCTPSPAHQLSIASDDAVAQFSVAKLWCCWAEGDKRSWSFCSFSPKSIRHVRKMENFNEFYEFVKALAMKEEEQAL